MPENQESGSSTGVVAVVAIFVLIVLAALYVFRGRIFSRGTQKIEINVNAQSK